MSSSRLPLRDPRTVARDIPGVLDILFPRLSGGMVQSLNKGLRRIEGISPVPEAMIEQSQLQKAMLFELASVRAELILREDGAPSWEECLALAVARQRRHFDAKIPTTLSTLDMAVAERACANLVNMLHELERHDRNSSVEIAPRIPGLGWIAPGNGDFSLGVHLIEVKHTNRNFVSGDFRQVLMYWLLKYAASVETNETVWSEVILLNPRRNCWLKVNFDFLLKSASANLNRVELSELLRSVVGQDADRR
ncbi:hypothetical protein AB9E19_14405 [Rhizobium leguminosarum]|uniref:hypothetical protein n=1 Tax=Rhizobium leguminosarum TaxID=384 RepID=UPI003F96ABDB